MTEKEKREIRRQLGSKTALFYYVAAFIFLVVGGIALPLWGIDLAFLIAAPGLIMVLLLIPVIVGWRYLK